MPDGIQTILIVEDEKSIRDVLKLNLQMDSYEVLTADNGVEAIELIKDQKIDLILMDVMLPEINGLEAANKIKSIRPDLPIIMLSALDQSVDRVKGLKAGADDYVNKPFNYEELLLRIQKQLDKVKFHNSEATTINIGTNQIDLVSYTIKNAKGLHQMSSKEASLIKYLYDNKNRVISREEIFANVWEYKSFPNSRTVDNYISSLRKYLACEKNTGFIHSERGVGYKLIL